MFNEWRDKKGSNSHEYGYKSSGKRMCRQGEIERADIEKAIAKVKCGKAAGIFTVYLYYV